MKILVIGESCTDRFVYGHVQDRKCPEAPAFILSPSSTSENAGMAANTQANVKSLGVHCDIITNLEQIIKERLVDVNSNYLLLRVDHNENSVNRIDRTNISPEKLSEYEAIIISDYNKGFLSESDIQYICQNHKLVFLDTKKILGDFCLNAKYININNFEYRKSQPFINEEYFYEKLIITLGPKGCQHKDKIYPVKKIEVIDQVGAGDTFIASLAVKFTKNPDIAKAIRFANSCATEVVKKRGVATAHNE